MASNRFLDYKGTYRDLHKPALVVAGSSALIALMLSLFLILQHLRSYTNPAEQKWIVAVLFMVPVYASESILSLWNSRFSLVCDILRSCYEAFALYSFGRYLIACLGGERRVINLLEDKSQDVLRKSLLEEPTENRSIRSNPFCDFVLRPCALGKDLLTIENFGLVQYMILKTVSAFLALVLEISGVYGDGEFKWYYGYPYIAVVLNFSQMWALFCLLQFYNVTHEILKPIKPLAKFISFKAIVFATWWQGVGISLLCALGVLPNVEKVQTGLQDFLICIEMAIAAVAHVFVFSNKPYRFLPAAQYRNITQETTRTILTVEERDEETQAVLQRKETQVEAPGTSFTESVQDIVVKGGENVVKDVVLTINQAIGPVEKGATKIQETFLHKSVSNEREEESEIEVDKRVEETRVFGETETKAEFSENVILGSQR